jgi:hypothetical protein
MLTPQGITGDNPLVQRYTTGSTSAAEAAAGLEKLDRGRPCVGDAGPWDPGPRNAGLLAVVSGCDGGWDVMTRPVAIRPRWKSTWAGPWGRAGPAGHSLGGAGSFIAAEF